MPNAPGTTYKIQDAETTLTPQEAELPTVVIGPLYQVFKKEQSDTKFDPLTAADQAIDWPGKQVGTVADLAGTRNGLIDSQRKPLVDYIPKVYLIDGTTEHEVDDEDISGLDQTGFDLAQEARDGLDRGDFDVFIHDLDGEQFLYKPDGGLSDLQVGDRVEIGSNAYTIDSVSSTRVGVEESLTSDLSTLTRVEESVGDSETVTIAPATTSGRVVVTVTGTDFATEVVGIATGQTVEIGKPMTGLTSLQGQADVTTGEVFDGLTFGVTTSTEEVENKVLKVVNYATDSGYSTVDEVYFFDIVSVDSDAGTVTVSDDISSAGVADDDYVEVTILDGQVGYIESINNTEDALTVIVPETFSDSNTYVDIAGGGATSTTVYPEFDVQVSYRALRADLADQHDSAASEDEFLDQVGHDSIDPSDILGYAMRITTLAQPSNNSVFYIPVDLEPDSSTGLPENQDIVAGYTSALEAAEALDVYNVITYDQSQAVRDILQSHVDTMSTPTENAYRRGYFLVDVPMGAEDSQTGEIAAGRVAGGVAASATDGNKVIRDDNVDFVTGAGVVAGTEVVVTFPDEFAGTYTALGTTTDNDLILDGDGWDLTKEFEVTSVDVNTPTSGQHVIAGASADTFVHVEEGDYVEVEESSTIYRLKVESVNGTYDELTCSDEVPGDLDFGTGNSGNGSNLSVIRTWDTVDYYIDPLSKSQQVAELVDGKSYADMRYTLMLNHAPTIQTGTDENNLPVKEELDPVLSLLAVAAKRSGNTSNVDVTNSTLGAGIEDITYGFGYFKASQLKSLSDAGYTLLAQQTADSAPYIRDMITTDTSSVLVQEEMILANTDWMGKTLNSTFGTPVGQTPPNITGRLLGLRTIQTETIFKQWASPGATENGQRVRSYRIISVEQDEVNARKTVITVSVTVVVAEKEIEFIFQRTV